MVIKKFKDCPEFTAGDNTILRELLHPDKAKIDLRYSLAHAILKPTLASTPHRLKTSEVYYIISGRGKMHINEELTIVEPTDTVYIPPHSTQNIENIGQTNLEFLCIVDPAWKIENEEIL